MIEKYFRLLDLDRNGMIVRIIRENEDMPKEYQFEKVRGWVETGVMTLYWFDFSKYYDEYEEISKAEALRIIADTKYRY